MSNGRLLDSMHCTDCYNVCNYGRLLDSMHCTDCYNVCNYGRLLDSMHCTDCHNVCNYAVPQSEQRQLYCLEHSEIEERRMVCIWE